MIRISHFRTILFVLLLVGISLIAHSQTVSKKRVFGEVGMGFGQTLFFGDVKEKLNQALGGTFEPGVGNNLLIGFYIAPENWKGFGVGARIKGTFGTSVQGENDPDDYIFNYYNLAASVKYYFIGREYNQGVYARASLGFGQFTAKRVNEANKRYTHQYAIGSTTALGIGYTFPLKTTSLSIETELERSARNGTIDGVGDATFSSGQFGANLILTF